MFRTTLSGLVVVIAFGFAGSAKAENLEVSLKQTGWLSEYTNDQGQKIGVGMCFRADGGFAFITEIGGKVEKSEGTYTIENNVIKIKLNGANKEIEVVSLEGDTLITTGGKKGEFAWKRLKQ